MSHLRKWCVVIWAIWLCAGTVLPARANPETPPEDGVHVVVVGETLLVIARQYGVSVADLQEANGLDDPNRLAIGQRLIIPGFAQPTAAPTLAPEVTNKFKATHVVVAGESLSRIAARYGTTTAELAEVNGLANPNQLLAGQRLLVPGDVGNVTQVGLDEQAMPWPFASFELRSPEPVQGDTVMVLVETVEEAELKGSFEGQEIRFAHNGRSHWGLLPIHPMADVGPYDVKVQATVPGKEPVSIVGQVWVKAGGFDVEDITIPPDKTSLLDRELIRVEREKLGQALETTDVLPLWRGFFAYPITDPVVSSEFGIRRSYNGGPATSYHEGLDFDASAGDLVMAAADGRVVMAEPLTVRGNAILVDHGLGVHTGYWHLSEINVTAGQEVKAGDVIGKVGSSGLSTGAHLHWEIRIGQINVNPVQWTRQVFP